MAMPKEGSIHFLGLDNSGKTTLLHMLKDLTLTQHAPTQHPTSEEQSVEWIDFRAIDLGGGRAARPAWKDYYAETDAVVYMVDAADRARFAESAAELAALLSDDALAGVPFLVLGNKFDVRHAASQSDLAHHLGLTGYTTGKGPVDLAGARAVEIFMCSVFRIRGFFEGFKWLSYYMS